MLPAKLISWIIFILHRKIFPIHHTYIYSLVSYLFIKQDQMILTCNSAVASICLVTPIINICLRVGISTIKKFTSDRGWDMTPRAWAIRHLICLVTLVVNIYVKKFTSGRGWGIYKTRPNDFDLQLGCCISDAFLIFKNLLLWNRLAKWTEIWQEASKEGPL
jgi:hypothetical protein